MPFRPKDQQPDFTSLLGNLAQSQKLDPAARQTIKLLIDRLNRFQILENKSIEELNNIVGDINSVINIVADKLRTFVTVTDEVLHLPHSRQLIAGTDIVIHTPANQVEINLNALETILTRNNETGTLANSIRLAAGTGITLDYSVPNVLTISSSASGGVLPMSLGGGVPIEWMASDDDGQPLAIEFDGA